MSDIRGDQQLDNELFNTIDHVSVALLEAEKWNLEAEVIATAFLILQETSTTSIESALAQALIEWDI